MKEIKKKISPKYFKEVAEGKKDFEIRKDDSNYEVGDILILEECYQEPIPFSYSSNGKQIVQTVYTGNKITKRIKYKITHEEFPQGIQEGYCILGLEPVGTDDILRKLLDQGLDSKTIQECYERYRWHIDYYKNAIKLKNIDLTGWNGLQQYQKIEEELKEFDEATVEYILHNTEANKAHAIEEYLDVVQSALGLLAIAGITAEEVMKEYPKHLEKLKSRPREKKCEECKWDKFNTEFSHVRCDFCTRSGRKRYFEEKEKKQNEN